MLRRATALLGQRGFDAVSVDVVLGALKLNRASFYKLYGSKYGLARAALEQVCDRARASDVDQDSMDLVVAFLELAPVSDDMRKIASQACDLCFASGPRRVGQRLPAGANRAMP